MIDIAVLVIYIVVGYLVASSVTRAMINDVQPTDKLDEVLCGMVGVIVGLCWPVLVMFVPFVFTGAMLARWVRRS